MKPFINILLALLISIGVACCTAKDETYVPSIASLKTNETLVMQYNSCHWGCMYGTIKFTEGAALYNQHKLILTQEEIFDLDEYFKLGIDPEGKSKGKAWCSLIILSLIHI